MFNYINQRLRDITLNYDLVYDSCRKRIISNIVLTSVLLLCFVLVSIFNKYDNISKYLWVTSLIVSFILIERVSKLWMLHRLVPYSDEASAFVVLALNDVSHMKHILKDTNPNLNIELLRVTDVDEIDIIEKRSLIKYVRKYRIFKEITGIIILSLLIGLLFHFNIVPNIPRGNEALKIIYTFLIVISLRLLVPSKFVKKLYYKDLDKHLFNLFERGVISKYQYKYFILFICDLRNDILFEIGDALQLDREGIDNLTEIFEEYNKLQTLSIFKIAEGMLSLICISISVFNKNSLLFSVVLFIVITLANVINYFIVSNRYGSLLQKYANKRI